MEIDFNSDLGEKFFPNGCSMCGRPVEFKTHLELFGWEKDEKYFSCSFCGAYVKAHKNGHERAYQPIGVLADNQLRNLHGYLRTVLIPFWKYQDDVTPIIQNIYPKFVLTFLDEEGEDVIAEVASYDKENKTYLMEAEGGKMYTVPTCNASKITMQDKVYFWLSKQMGIPYSATRIQLFDYEQTNKAIEILEQFKPKKDESQD